MFEAAERRRKPRFCLPWLTCLLVSLAGAAGYELWILAREPRWAELHLDAKPTAAGLELSWDRTAAPVARAARGTLSITDGSDRRTIELSAAEVRDGRFFYHAMHPEVLFRLHVYGDELQSSGDTLRYMSSVREVLPAPVTAAAAVPRMTSGADRAAPARTGPLTAATPPAVLDEVPPQIPDGIRARIEGRIVIPVDVAVSRSGKVTAATSDAEGDGLHRYLAEQASAAVRSWRFTPARAKNGEPVPGRKTVYLTFAP